MGYIGYYIKKNNILSVIIIMPVLILLAIIGLGYFSSVIDNFPHHLLSCIFCFMIIIIFVINLFDKTKIRLAAFTITTIFIIGYIILTGGIINSEYDSVQSLSKYNFSGEITVTSFTGTKKGNVDLIKYEDSYNIRLNGMKGGEYTFEITDDNNEVYAFKYYFDKNKNTIILKKTN